MLDTLAGRRVLEFFGLLAIAPAAKKEDKVRWPFVESGMKKVVKLERPGKNK
jgi:hypothetical protein